MYFTVLKDDESDDDDECLVNYGGGENDDTPLHEACSAGHLEMVKMLLEKGAKINVTNWDSETALHHACKENHQIVAEFLVEKWEMVFTFKSDLCSSNTHYVFSLIDVKSGLNEWCRNTITCLDTRGKENYQIENYDHNRIKEVDWKE